MTRARSGSPLSRALLLPSLVLLAVGVSRAQEQELSGTLLRVGDGYALEGEPDPDGRVERTRLRVAEAGSLAGRLDALGGDEAAEGAALAGLLARFEGRGVILAGRREGDALRVTELVSPGPAHVRRLVAVEAGARLELRAPAGLVAFDMDPGLRRRLVGAAIDGRGRLAVRVREVRLPDGATRLEVEAVEARVRPDEERLRTWMFASTAASWAAHRATAPGTPSAGEAGRSPERDAEWSLSGRERVWVTSASREDGRALAEVEQDGERRWTRASRSRPTAEPGLPISRDRAHPRQRKSLLQWRLTEPGAPVCRGALTFSRRSP